jgi:Family of unknown function (DUF6510)
MDENDVQVDGNAAGGLLQSIFPFEMTAAMTICAGCGANEPIGALVAYALEIGTVLRCPHCDQSMIRIAHHSGSYWLDLRGAALMQIAEE